MEEYLDDLQRRSEADEDEEEVNYYLMAIRWITIAQSAYQDVLDLIADDELLYDGDLDPGPDELQIDVEDDVQPLADGPQPVLPSSKRDADCSYRVKSFHCKVSIV